ncbi:unnamed protein product [Rhizoctonia solani]|uniref:NACHT domain-containing protein n=1 Tax=Rhizoctonia solani TaxID=456999 RepID=A0A8H3ATE5_9AGAM|nr:unnamed protein product [Rhizoctonia solani]
MYNSTEATDVNRGPCAPETRKAELEKLSGWAHRTQAHKIYWLNGMAGTGKTTIVYSLCTELDSSRRLGASFFCSRMIPECRNVKHILPSIAYQLASFSLPFRYALSQVLKSDRDVHNRLLKNQFDSLIVKPLQEARHTLSFDIIVVIDALDECENENSVGQILDVLLGNDQSLPIRFLISSRPEPGIYRRMMKQVGESFDARLVLHELDQITVKNDIRAYLTHELDDIPLTPTQLEALVERSGVLFIYAATAAGYIKAGYLLMDHEERLDMILGTSPFSSEGKDKHIDELYNTILNAAFNNTSLDQLGRERMGTVLNTVICAQEPMTTHALAGLLKLKSGEQVEALLRPLGSVLHVSEKSGLVTALHTSFPDFLLDQRRSTMFYCNLAQHNKIIARACLGVIKHHDPQFNICNIESSYHPDEKIADLDERINKAISPQLFYSCRHWANHVQLAGEPRELAESVLDFLSVRLLLWMEVLNLKKCIHLGVNIMRQIENWGRQVEAPVELTELAHDAWRFVTMFASHPVSRSTPHIYISMLPFWPAEGPISLHYTSRTQNIIKPAGIALINRQPALLATWSFGSQVRSTKFSPDGSRIAVASGKELFIINGSTGQRLVGPLKGHTNTISSAEFSPDGLHVASSSWDGTIRVWNAQTGQMPVPPLAGHALSVESIHFSPDSARLVSGSWDTTLRVWDITTGEMVMGPLEGHIAFVTSVMFSPDGNLIASGSSDKTIRIWEAQSGAMKYVLEGHTAGVTSVAFSPDGSYLASGARDKTIKRWDVKREFEPWVSIEGYIITAIQFSPDGQRIVSASEDNTIRIITLERPHWKDAVSLRGHTNYVISIMFSQDGSRILSGSSDNTVRVWDAKARLTTTQYFRPASDGHHNEVNLVQYLPDDAHIVSKSIDRVVRSWHPQTCRASGNADMHLRFAKEQGCIAFSRRGGTVSGSLSGVIQVHSNDQASFRATVTDRHGAISALAWSPNDEFIAAGLDAAIQLWDIRTRQVLVNQHTSPPNRVTSVVFSLNSQFFAATSGNIITIWDIEDGQRKQNILEGHTQLTTSVSFSPDNKLIASGSKDTTVRVWNFQTRRTAFGPFRGHTDEVTCLTFSPDGTRIASGSRDMRICLWDLHSEDMLFETLEGHTGAVLSVAFSHSGAYIVSGSSDCAIRIWTSKPENTNPDSVSRASFGSWSLTREGWITDSRGRALLWVPTDLRAPLLMPRNTGIICANGSLNLDFESTTIGETWSGCYTPVRSLV